MADKVAVRTRWVDYKEKEYDPYGLHPASARLWTFLRLQLMMLTLLQGTARTRLARLDVIHGRQTPY